MNQDREILNNSYAFCRRFSKRSGSNFYLGFLLLPREKRRAMDALYAFMRHTDDLVDEERDGFVPAIDQRKDQLNRWRELLDTFLAAGNRRFADPVPPSGEIIIDFDTTEKLLLPALVDTVNKFGVPVECLTAVIDGVEMDLDRRRYETFDELRQYCQRVASAVGLACIHVWGFKGQGTPLGDAAFEPAWQAGIALQLTNILRDLKTDADADRIYLPMEDLRESGYSVEELKQGAVNEAFYRLMAIQIDRAKLFYREGVKLMDFLHKDGRRIYGLMMTTYMMLFMKIARSPGDVFSRTIGLGKLQRLLPAAVWAFLPSAKIDKFSQTAGKILSDE